MYSLYYFTKATLVFISTTINATIYLLYVPDKVTSTCLGCVGEHFDVFSSNVFSYFHLPNLQGRSFVASFEFCDIMFQMFSLLLLSQIFHIPVLFLLRFTNIFAIINWIDIVLTDKNKKSSSSISTFFTMCKISIIKWQICSPSDNH